MYLSFKLLVTSALLLCPFAFRRFNSDLVDKSYYTEIWTGNFKIPAQAVKGIITIFSLRTGGLHLRAYERYLVRESRKWELSIQIGDVEGDPSTSAGAHIYRYVQMKMVCREMSLFLAHFTTAFDIGTAYPYDYVYYVDNVTWSDGVISVKRDHDHLVLQTEGNETTTWFVPRFESWFGNLPTKMFCKIHHFSENMCVRAEYFLPLVNSSVSNICLKNSYKGDSNGISMKILSMTGIFRERSFLSSETPIESVSGHYFQGLRKITADYPCMFATQYSMGVDPNPPPIRYNQG